LKNKTQTEYKKGHKKNKRWEIMKKHNISTKKVAIYYKIGQALGFLLATLLLVLAIACIITLIIGLIIVIKLGIKVI